jgi:hypothetical protein
LRPARTVFTAIVAAAATTGISAAPAVAESILVSPGTPHPGDKIHISVPGCSVGPTPHTAKSGAFEHDVTLYGKADTGEGDPKLKNGLKPGTYPITAFCGKGRTVHGQVVVIAKGEKPGAPGAPSREPGMPPAAVHTESSRPQNPAATLSASPTASHGSGSSTPYWVLGAAVVVLVGGAVLFVVRRRAN